VVRHPATGTELACDIRSVAIRSLRYIGGHCTREVLEEVVG
jgi:hypothetical protein